MLGAGAGTATADAIYLLVELGGFVALVVVSFFARSANASQLVAVLVAAALLAPVAPVAWSLAQPPASGIEGAGRFLLAVPTTALVVAASTTFALRAARPAGLDVVAVRALVAAHVACLLASWAWLLFG